MNESIKQNYNSASGLVDCLLWRLSIMAGATVAIKQTKEYKNCQNFTNFKDFLMCNIINTFYISDKILSDKCIYDIIQKNTINN